MFDYMSVKESIILCIFICKVSVSVVLRGFSPGVVQGSEGGGLF